MLASTRMIFVLDISREMEITHTVSEQLRAALEGRAKPAPASTPQSLGATFRGSFGASAGLWAKQEFSQSWRNGVPHQCFASVFKVILFTVLRCD